MIKLFRNIRKNLLAEGKTSRYLKYAIGEIILVVIGILIALSINNWNEKRKEATMASQMINVLIGDLNEKKKELTSDLRIGENLINKSQPIIDAWKNQSIIDSTNIKFVLNVIGQDNWFFNELTPTYTSLANSSLWNHLPDSLTNEVNQIYISRFGTIKKSFEKATEYATHCKLNYLAPNNFLSKTQTSLEIHQIVQANPKEFIIYLELFRNGVFRLTESFEKAIKSIDKATNNLQVYKTKIDD